MYANLHAREPGGPALARPGGSPGGRLREAEVATWMNEYGKSDRPVVPVKPPNKTAVAEVVEERV